MKETTSKYLVRGLATGLLLTGLGAGYTTTTVAADDVIPGQEQLAPVTQSQSFTVTFKNMYIGSSHLGDAISINVTADAAGNYIATIPDNFLQNRIATTNLPADIDQNAYSFINDQSVTLNVDYLTSHGLNGTTIPVYFAGNSSATDVANSDAQRASDIATSEGVEAEANADNARSSAIAASQAAEASAASYNAMVSSLAAQEESAASASLAALQATQNVSYPAPSDSISVPSEAPEPVTPSSVAPSEGPESIAPSYSSSLSVVPSSITLPKSSDLPGSVAPSNSVPMPPVSSIDSSASAAPITSASSASQTSVAPSDSAVSVAPRNVRQTSKPAIDLATVTAASVLTSVNATTHALAPKLVAERASQKSVAVAKQTTDTPATTDTVTTTNASQPTQAAVASVAHQATVAEAAQKNALPNIFKNNTTTHLDLTNNTPAYKPESTFNTGNVTSVASILVSAFSGFAYFLGGVPKGVTRFFDWMFNLFGK
ncbi:hypothetical protein PKU16_01170 [Weissella cibaria]|uniref:hypothetical protein n=1 Tax=Weissella cibaria TaxID=137591 RepID=UPI000705F43D|nr:hypothetical protein [Weissella cibaria]ALI32094.1 hypothetical protein AO080_00810 [Weissella cibaria]WCE25244.1 hypothetical protein PKU16_01170 [Weissella cibaria]WCE27432.1 hypothetical protein PKU15_01170 [Weissella cibaria]HCN25665.1 hypothetical protein [Weissella cibaria]HCU09346.1 hypothetical protein [Weissella cibaria]